MTINKFEAVGIGVSIGAMALALFLIRLDTSLPANSAAREGSAQQAAVVVANDSVSDAALADAVIEATGGDGTVERLIVDDVIIGTGDAVEEGDTVSVHYIGTLQSGQQFDNSYAKEKPLTFTLGEGRVIEGWERGILGMQKGGKRILVIPASLAYGANGYGPIPGNATLVFAVELVEVK